MKVLITGSSGHLGEALVRTMSDIPYEVIGIDILPSPYTHKVGSITDRQFVKQNMKGVDAVLHTATLHKPHIATHSYQHFIDTNINGTLNLLEEAAAAGVKAFVYTSTTSTFGEALTPPEGAPAAWVTEEVVPIPKNIYGITKTAAEDLCKLFYHNTGMACVILRTSRFFQEEDDQKNLRQDYEDRNLKVNEFLYRRVDIEDVVNAHLLAMDKAGTIGFGRYIISATTPFIKDDLLNLNTNAPLVVKRLFPYYEELFARQGWKMLPKIGRVYVNELARKELGWNPVYDFGYILARLKRGKELFSPLTYAVGKKGYHNLQFKEGPYPV